MDNYQVLVPLFREYARIMEEEAKLNPACEYFASRPADIYHTAVYLGEIARSSTVLRGWCHQFGLCKNEKVAYESVGAHTRLMISMLDRALTAIYGPNCENYDGFSYREIMKAANLHDLPENKTGDILDNGERDEAEKEKLEEEYFELVIKNCFEFEEGEKLKTLLKQMVTKEALYRIGRLLYAADKTAAIIAALAYDKLWAELQNTPASSEIVIPSMRDDFEKASWRDHAEIRLSDTNQRGEARASEMFTADVLNIRELNQYDDTGFFTSIIVMYTLIVNGKWYHWRENDYAITP